MKKAVAYIDLLGFTDCVQNNPDEAIMMLTQFNSVLSSLNFERVAHPSSGYLHGLQDLARRNSNESFEHFLPFSDSVFIVSSDCSNFLMQLGNFVKDSFLLNARVYSNPENPSNPTETHYIGFDSSNPNCNKPVSIPCSQPPVLFRGGLSYGEVIETSPTALFKNHIFTCNNLMGEAVIRAVRMERVVKGPRIIFDQEMYSQLNEDVKLYCRSIPDKIKDNGTAGLYEILWPALGFILENKTSFYQEITHFYDLFKRIYIVSK